ncbi:MULTISPECIES: hypothetical protein [unclassified Streptomyces]|uniref:hypothetical protein n=1 Tax=unclassified Streptomyces TaxID=2593676 RepID=UPI00344C1B61
MAGSGWEVFGRPLMEKVCGTSVGKVLVGSAEEGCGLFPGGVVVLGREARSSG